MVFEGQGAQALWKIGKASGVILRTMRAVAVVAFVVAITAVPAWADRPERDEEVLRKIFAGLNDSFSLPLSDFLKKEYESEWMNLLSGFSGAHTFASPLIVEAFDDGEGEGVRQRTGRTPVYRTTVKYNPISYWFASATYYRYLDTRSQADWNPDFSYTFGYDDWHPYTLSLIYANYGGNRIFPSDGESRTEFQQGTWSLGWKFPVPKDIADIFLVDRSGGIACALNFNLTPEYFDLAASENKDFKQVLSLGCKYIITGNWYINWAVNYYPDYSQQQPWDPDFTYGFGYFDWHPGSITVQYNNYSGNRYPGRRSGDETGRFIDGEVMVSWSWAF